MSRASPKIILRIYNRLRKGDVGLPTGMYSHADFRSFLPHPLGRTMRYVTPLVPSGACPLIYKSIFISTGGISSMNLRHVSAVDCSKASAPFCLHCRPYASRLLNIVAQSFPRFLVSSHQRSMRPITHRGHQYPAISVRRLHPIASGPSGAG